MCGVPGQELVLGGGDFIGTSVAIAKRIYRFHCAILCALFFPLDFCSFPTFQHVKEENSYP